MNNDITYPPKTLRRLRSSRFTRELASEVSVHHQDFIQPLFVDEALAAPQDAAYLPGVQIETNLSVIHQIERDLQAGISKFLLFPVPQKKAVMGFSFAFAETVVADIIKQFGADLWLAGDLCLCSYTTHGHCGVLTADTANLDNAKTVDVLVEYALTLARAGCHCIAPSDMTDGRVGAIRQALDTHNFDDCSIMSYSAKFASVMYGPFRDVCKSSPANNIQLKDRKTYQLSPDYPSGAFDAALRDEREGADFIMVKPAIPYLDILAGLRRKVLKPLVAYHVSGEYAALELLAREGLAAREDLHRESWIAIKRAGASAIISYAARNAQKWLLH